jgi:hypothetical protein
MAALFRFRSRLIARPMAMSASSTTDPRPTPTPMPIFGPLDGPPEPVSGFAVGDWVAAEPVGDTPRDEAADGGVAVGEGVGDGVKRTPIFAANGTAFSEGKRDKSDSSHATYSGSAMAVPRDNVRMLEMVDLSMTCS